jgi:hypothetical protein
VVQIGFKVRPLDECIYDLKPARKPFVPGGCSSSVLAVQMHLIGRDDLLGSLVPWWDLHLRGRNAVADGRAELRIAALWHWEMRAGELDSDWGHIVGRLRALRMADSAIPFVTLIDIRAMEATVAGRPRPHRKGDELIDRVILLPSSTGRGLGSGASAPPAVTDKEPDLDPYGACRRLREGGFVVIAALVRGLDDKRLTRRGCGYCLRVDQVCSEFLEDIIGRDTVAAWKVHPADGEVLPKKKVQAWWEKIRKLSEEEYYARSVLTLYKDENSKHHLAFLARKYPKALLSLYRKLLRDYPARDGADLLAVLMNSKLPNKTKGEAILAGIVEGNPLQRRAALRQLINLMPDEFLQLLLPPFADAKVKKTK